MCSVSTRACSEAPADEVFSKRIGGSGGNTEQESAARSHCQQHADPRTARAARVRATSCSAARRSERSHHGIMSNLQHDLC
jgi:hypothetical protein